jgi:hypothetical protein
MVPDAVISGSHRSVEQTVDGAPGWARIDDTRAELLVVPINTDPLPHAC